MYLIPKNRTGVVEIFSAAVGEFTISNLAAQKVLTPSTDGCTIVSAKGGETYNFTSKDASFAHNAASYRVVVRKIR